MYINMLILLGYCYVYYYSLTQLDISSNNKAHMKFAISDDIFHTYNFICIDIRSYSNSSIVKYVLTH